MTPEEFEILNHRVVVVSNSISLALCSILIFLVIVLISYRRELLTYTSYMISITILAADVMYASFQITSVTTWSIPACNLSSWGVVFTTVFSMQLACILAMHLQLIVIHKIRALRWIMVVYVLVPLNISTIVSLLPVIFGQIGYHREIDWTSCWYHNPSSGSGRVWSFATFYGWIIFAVLYCTVVVLLVVYRLCRYTAYHKLLPNSVFTITALRRSIRVIILYPTVPIVCYSLTMYLLLFPTSSSPYSIQLTSAALQGLQGTLNSLIFISNPILIRAFRSLRGTSRAESSRLPQSERVRPSIVLTPPKPCYLPSYSCDRNSLNAEN